MAEEIFKDIVEFEGRYQISNLGNVFSLIVNKPRLANSKNQFGHLAVTLLLNGKIYKRYVHRLVAIHFIPNPENKRQVHHKDFNPQNNIVTNLVWATASEDCIYTARQNRGGGSVKPKKRVVQFNQNGDMMARYDSMREAERATGVRQQDISRQLAGKNYFAGGYKWEYAK